MASSISNDDEAGLLSIELLSNESRSYDSAVTEEALSADLERVASSKCQNNEANSMNIQLFSNDSSLGDAQIRVQEGQVARNAIQAAYATITADQMKRLVVCMAGDEIDMESSFEANGIEDGARLEVCLMLCPCLSIWHCC